MGDSGRTTSYHDTPYVFSVVQGGAKAWYVAEDAGAALTCHLGMLEGDPLEPFTVAAVKPDEKITLYAKHHDAADLYPAHWRDEDDDSVPMHQRNVTALAAEYAAYHADHINSLRPALQLCTTEY